MLSRTIGGHWRPWLVSTGMLALVLGATACRTSAPEPTDQTPAPGERTVIISGRCAEDRLIRPAAATETAADTWQEIQPTERADCFRLTATDSDATGVAPDSEFMLESEVEFEPEELEQLLGADPGTNFYVEQIEGRVPGALRRGRAHGPARIAQEAPTYRYRVRPQSVLDEGRVYRIHLLDGPAGEPVRTWAFQTRQPLRVVQTLPGDRATYVPLDTAIELTFNQDGVTGIEDHFAIDPPVEGRWEQHKRTWVFVPRKLEPNTLYTARLEPGAGVEGSQTSLAEPKIFRFETGQAEGDQNQPSNVPALQFYRRMWESPPDQVPALSVYGFTGEPGTLAGRKLPVSVYHYSGTDDYLAALDAFAEVPAWAGITRQGYTVDPSNLAKVATFEATLEPIGQYGELLVRFPEALEPGFYLVEATFQGQPVQAWLQVTDVAPYVSISTPRTMVWVNDLATGQPLAKAEVHSTVGGLAAQTGEDGIALVDTPLGLIKDETTGSSYINRTPVGNLVVTAPDGRTAVTPLADTFQSTQGPRFNDFRSGGDADLYWRYLYTDRALYHMTDNVRFWGVVRRREAAPSSQELVAEIVNEGFTDINLQPSVLAGTVVPTGASGTFKGELTFKGASPGYYSLRVRDGDQVLVSTPIEVQDFVKPAYKVEVAPSRQALLAEEPMTFTVQAAFFEGSPVPGLALNYGGIGQEGTLTTDVQGTAALPYTPSAESVTRDSAYSGYAWVNLYVTPALAEEGEIGGNGWVRVFPATITLDGEAKIVGNTATLTGTVHEVDLERLNSDKARDLDDFRGPAVPNQPVRAKVEEISYNKIETGEVYDPITKSVIKTYDYVQSRKPLGEFSATSDAEGRYAIPFPVQAGRSYEAEVSVTDGDGRTASRSLFVDNGYAYVPSNQVTLDTVTEGPFAPGQAVEVAMRGGNEALPPGEGSRYLFYRAQNGIRDYTAQDDPQYSFTFDESDSPNTNVIGVRFAGKTYQEVTFPLTAALDTALRKLNVAIEPKQASYGPGEEATLNVTVTDPEGKPVQAEVLLSAVDEAIVQLQGQSFFDAANILGSLFQRVPSGVLRTYASYQYPQGAAGAEGGGGGDGRSTFEDTALFERVMTDADGHAAVTFTLPDNLTSWRITGLGLTDNQFAGSSSALLPVTLPFFVDATLNETYLTTDRPKLRLRAFGEALAEHDPITYEITAKTLSDTPLTATGTAFQGTEVELPALTEGRHELTIRAEAGEHSERPVIPSSTPTTQGGYPPRPTDEVVTRTHSDTLVGTINVVPSHLLKTKTEVTELTSGETYDATLDSKERAQIVLTDHNRGRYYPALLALAWTYSDRLDAALARHVAADLLATQFSTPPNLASEFHSPTYQTDQGGLALLPFGDADLALSARAAGLAPDLVGRQELVKYFTGELDDPKETRERAIIALYGLAALGEPVLTNVQALAAAADLSVRERLYLGLAASAAGDSDTASRIYSALLGEFGQGRGNSVRLNVGEDQADVLEATSLAAVLGVSLGDDVAPLLFQYTQDNHSGEHPTWLEEAAFLADALPRLPGEPVRFDLTTGPYYSDLHNTFYDLITHADTELHAGDSRTLILGPGQLGAVHLKVSQGTLGVATSTLVPLDLAAAQPDPDVTVTRAYETGPQQALVAKSVPKEVTTAQQKVAVSDGELVRITLPIQLGAKAVDGCYQLTDILPSGLKAVTQPYQRGITSVAEGAEADYPYAIEGQRVSFCVYRDAKKPVVYYARVLGQGTYAAEPALLQSAQAPESFGLSRATEFDIR